MKTLNALFSCMILSGVTTGNLRAQQPAVIKIDLDRRIGEVDPKIYGAFVEPIRSVVYGTIYDPRSSLADESGFRKDFIALVKDLKIPVVRWPGGNYVSGYNWEDGIGAKEQRPRRLELAWRTIETNEFGTDEFMDWCHAAGTEPMMAVNLGSRGLDAARTLLE